jgi:hypothetical protein
MKILGGCENGGISPSLCHVNVRGRAGKRDKISTSWRPSLETLSRRLMMGKRKAPNGESSDGVAVAEDSGSDEVRGPFLTGCTVVGLFCADL